MLELITNKAIFEFLFNFITITLISHHIIITIVDEKKSKEDEEKTESNSTSLRTWMGIMHLFSTIICIILIFKIPIFYKIFQILAIIFYISLLMLYFIQICFTSGIRKNTELNGIEIKSYLYFSSLFLLLINNSNTTRIYEILYLFSKNYSELFKNIFIIILLVEIFFFIFIVLYCLFIILKDIKALLLFIKKKIKINLNLKNNRLVKFIYGTEMYYYDFYFYMKFRNKKILKIIFFCIDLVILIFMTFLSFLIWIIRFPLFTLTTFLKLIYYIIIRIVNTDTSLFVFKWFRIILIISILITYIILKINSLEISASTIEIFELISTVILIPLIWEQLSEIREKK